jgi:hypothetical protein
VNTQIRIARITRLERIAGNYTLLHSITPQIIIQRIRDRLRLKIRVVRVQIEIHSVAVIHLEIVGVRQHLRLAIPIRTTIQFYTQRTNCTATRIIHIQIVLLRKLTAKLRII